jgi:hypothetical protein
MYQAFLLRCWREGQAAPGESPLWRFSVEEVLHERRQWGFASLEALLTFLWAELAGAEEGAAQDRERRRNDRSGVTVSAKPGADFQ